LQPLGLRHTLERRFEGEETELNDQPKWRFLAYFDSVEKIAGSVGAVVVLLTGIVGLVYLLWPNPSPPPPPRKAAMKIEQTFPDTTLADFLAETGQSTEDHSSAELDQVGNEYYINIAVEGLRNRSAKIVWNLHDVSELPPNEQTNWIHQLLDTIEPPADDFERTAKVWIQYPPVEGKFFAVIEIEYPDYVTLRSLRTSSFDGRRMQPREQAQPQTVTRTTTTVMTTPARTTMTVTTIEDTTTAVTTVEVTTTGTTTMNGTTTTSTSTIPTTSTVTITTTRTATVATTLPATTSTVTTTRTETSASTVPARVPIVRPKAEIKHP